MNGVGIWNEVVKWVADADSNSTDSDRPLAPSWMILQWCRLSSFVVVFCILYTVQYLICVYTVYTYFLRMFQTIFHAACNVLTTCNFG